MQMSTPLADFDHPLEMLAACHERIEDRLHILERLVQHIAAQGADEQAQQAAANIMRYFDTAGQHHHEDEEQNLFPRLRDKAPHGHATSALLDQLSAEHEHMRSLWLLLRAGLEKIVDGASAELDPERVARFNAAYRAHITLEERELLPAAARLLEPQEHALIGAEMARRRGVSR